MQDCARSVADRIKALAAPALEAPAAPAVPAGFALVPLRLTRAMNEVLEEEGWQWEDLLAAAEAVSEEQYESITHDRLSQDEVRAIFLESGFTIKEGQTDLKPYVYEAAQELEYRVRAALAAAPQAPAAPVEIDAREQVTRALGFEGDGLIFAWSYLIGQIEQLVECEAELCALKAAPAAPSKHAGLLAAAAHIQAKAQAHLDERGSHDPDTGAVEMSESNQEHFNTLEELAEEIRLLADKAAPVSCDKPPAGWTCSRAPGHDGPCAAAPAAPAVDELSQAARDVLAERRRQIERKGYDVEHDDAHDAGEIGALAALYLMPDASRDWDASSTGYGDTLGQAMLPRDWATPKMGEDRRADVVKGIATGFAELERIDRARARAAAAETGGAA